LSASRSDVSWKFIKSSGFTAHFHQGPARSRASPSASFPALELPRTLQPLEAEGEPERRGPTTEVSQSRRFARVFGDHGLTSVEIDPWPLADMHDRRGGDPLVAQLLLAVAFDEGEQPVGEIGGSRRRS
jgi:hypothetical protein